MRTSSIVKRRLGKYELPQRTKDECYNATDLLNQWNADNPDRQRSLDNFWKSTHLTEFMSEVAKNELNFNSVNFTDLKNVLSKTSRGKYNGGTWMNKYLFVKFAMYLNPAFEYQVVKFVADFMIKYRDYAGDAYKELASAVSKVCPREFIKPAMVNISTGINYVVFGEHRHGARDFHGDEEKQMELCKIEDNLTMLVNDGFLHSYEEVMEYLRKKYCEKYLPSVLKN